MGPPCENKWYEQFFTGCAQHILRSLRSLIFTALLLMPELLCVKFFGCGAPGGRHPKAAARNCIAHVPAKRADPIFIDMRALYSLYFMKKK